MKNLNTSASSNVSPQTQDPNTSNPSSSHNTSQSQDISPLSTNNSPELQNKIPESSSQIDVHITDDDTESPTTSPDDTTHTENNQPNREVEMTTFKTTQPDDVSDQPFSHAPPSPSLPQTKEIVINIADMNELINAYKQKIDTLQQTIENMRTTQGGVISIRVSTDEKDDESGITSSVKEMVNNLLPFIAMFN